MTISASRTAGARPAADAWDSQLWRPRFQGLLLSIAGLALLPALAATVLRVFPPADDPTARLAAFIPYGLLGYLIALSGLLLVVVRGPAPAGTNSDHCWRRGAYCLSPGLADAAVCQ